MTYYWRNSLDDAIAHNRRDAHHRYIQLATPGEDGYPANRTVVFRGFVDDGGLTFVTDGRSRKVRQVCGNDGAEICWYFTRSREQFRIRGKLAFFDGNSARSAARTEVWSRLSEGAREQFFWPTPGAPRGGGSEPRACEDGPPESFLLAVLSPDRIDHLQLAASPQRRFISVADSNGGWAWEAVNP